MSAQVNGTYRNRHSGEERTVLKREWVPGTEGPGFGGGEPSHSGYVLELDLPSTSGEGNQRIEENLFLAHYELVD